MTPEISILNLSPEILGIVTSYLDQEDLVSCFNIGNGHLTRLLWTNGSVTSLELRGTRIRFFSSLTLFGGLRKLVLLMNVKKTNWDPWIGLPPSLTWLELRNKFAFSSSTHVGSTLPLLRHLRLDVELGHDHQDWLSTLPSTLESMEVLKIHDSARLPVFLTSLRLIGASPIIPLPLPPSLRVLILNEATYGNNSDPNSFFALLPRSLEFLAMYEVSWQIDASTLHNLPSGLTSLTLDTYMFGRSRDSMFCVSGSLIAFPPSLTSLRLVGQLNMVDFAPFPPNLTMLDIISSASLDEDFFLHLLPLLPSGLLHFLIDLEEDIITAPISLPKHLKTLHISAAAFKLDWVLSLPKSITSLQLPPIHVEMHSRVENHTPWPLQSLCFPDLRRFQGSSHSSTLSLLHCLSFGCPKLSKIEFDGQSDLESKYCSSYTTFNFTDLCRSILASFSSLPPLETNEVYASLPETLNSGVQACEQTKNESRSLSSKEPSHSSSEPPFRFSDHLQTFWAYKCPFGDPMMAILPFSSLTVLGLPCSPFITNDHFKDIIQRCHHLKRLFAGSSAITGSVFAVLPRQISDLSLPESTLITDNDIAQLPRGITSLRLDCATLLSDRMGPSLPPRLTYLDLSENERVSKDIASYLPTTTLEVFMRTKKFTIWALYGRVKISDGWSPPGRKITFN